MDVNQTRNCQRKIQIISYMCSWSSVFWTTTNHLKIERERNFRIVLIWPNKIWQTILEQNDIWHSECSNVGQLNNPPPFLTYPPCFRTFVVHFMSTPPKSSWFFDSVMLNYAKLLFSRFIDWSQAKFYYGFTTYNNLPFIKKILKFITNFDLYKL